MEGQWIGRIMFIVSTMLFSTYDANPNPRNVDVNVEAHANGEKVIDALKSALKSVKSKN